MTRRRLRERAAGLLVAGLLMLAAAIPAAAQTIEFEVPEQIEVVPGRLAVTFADTVAEATARAVVGRAGYEIARVDFYPVVVWTAEAAPAAEAALRADTRVRAVEARADGGRTVTLVSTLTAEAARALVEAAGLAVAGVSKRSGEVTIVVAEGEEEAALERLSAEPSVRYVTYVGAAVE